MRIFSKISRWLADAITFHSTLAAWVGEGGVPVVSVVAQRRADVCLGCEFNRADSALTAWLGEAVRKQMAVKSGMRLTVTGEDRLHQCRLCRCHLALKVWVPMAHIRAYQRETVRVVLRENQPFCWQLLDD